MSHTLRVDKLLIRATDGDRVGASSSRGQGPFKTTKNGANHHAASSTSLA